MPLISTNFLSKSLNFIFPKVCISCKLPTASKDHPCCDNCYQSLPFQPPSCEQCGQAFAAEQDICGQCLSKPPSYDACFCPFEYQTPISEQIRDFKYHERPEYAQRLAQLLAREIQDNRFELPDLIVPVPLHSSRLRQRGFNQSALLAKRVGKILDVPVNHKSLIKKRKTDPQAHLSLSQRSRNLKRSFSLIKPINAQSVAIVDDVVTTGSTASEIAKILKRNGVDYVQVWGIAHTV